MSTPANERFSASVVIPAHGRPHLLVRAYASILACRGSKNVEVIVVDDSSDPPLSIPGLRDQDVIIRLPRKSGAAVGRNTGIDRAQGRFIYLLDSDDTFVDKNFDADFEALDESCLYYCDVITKTRSSFPVEIPGEILLDCILFKHPHICQTSSLVFHSRLGLRFDENLPKHQDWDFVLTAKHKNIALKKCDGAIFFDTSDKDSLSRLYDPNRSVPWFQKISEDDRIAPDIKFALRYHLFAKYISEIGWLEFSFSSIKLFVSRRTSLRFIIRSIAHRIIQIAGRRTTKAGAC